MSNSGANNNRTGEWGKISAPVALITFIIGLVAIVAAGVFFVKPEFFKQGLFAKLKGDNTVEANAAIPFAARVDRLDGDIGIARQTGKQDQPYQGWTKAAVNAPVSLGDRIRVNGASKAAVAFSTRNYARLNPNTSVDVVSLTPRHTQLALREGAGVFDIGALAPDEVFEVGTPNGAVDFTQPGLYQVGIDDGGDTVVSVFNGTAHCTGHSGTADVSKGQLLTLAAVETAEAIVSELSPTVAGTIVDDYYSYRYEDTYDHRYADYHVYEEDPYYYDRTYRRSASYQYIPEEDDIAGLEDLDDYGDWVDVQNYGHCWRPRNISADWAPYRDGYWSSVYTVGLTWVSNERWGWAPYHYGRWAHVNNDWFWVPTDAVRQPVYAPALVAFVSLPRVDEIGWVPLGPGDPYVPRYYDQDYRAHYVGPRDYVDRYVNYTNLVNYSDPAAVTVVSVTQFTQVITPRTVLRADPAYLASARPVLEPMTVPVVRQLAPTIEAARPTVAVPVEVQQIMSRPVVVRQQLAVPPVATNVAETLKVQPVSEDATKRKLQVKNIGQPVAATNPTNGLPAVPPEAKLSQMSDQERQARIAQLQAQANQGNKPAKRELRQLEEQQRQKAAQQALAQQQQQAEQRKAEKQAAQQQAQQTEQQRQQQAAQEAEQRKAQKQAARQQAQQAEQQRQQQAEQSKAEKRAQRQQQQAGQPEQQRQQQAAQQAEQRRAQKEAARQQAEQQRQQQAAQQAEQRRAQKEAARQQAQQAQQQAAQQAEQRKKQAAQQQAQQAEQQRQQQQAGQQAEQRRAQKEAARQQAQQAEQKRQQQAAHEAELRKAQKQAAQEQAQQEAARQQAQQEQRRVQKQAQQQAQQEQQQRQQQKAEKRTQQQQAEQQKARPPEQQRQQQAQPPEQQRQQQKAEKRAERQQAQPQPNPNKEEKRAEKSKNKNKNEKP